MPSKARAMCAVSYHRAGMGEPSGAGAGPDPVWERRHPGGPESWSFDFVAPDASVAGFVGLTIWNRPRLAWYWAVLVGRRRPYLLVRDLEVAAPRMPTSREVRSDGLWADVNCETPHDHWSLGLEAFGVVLDDPEEALGAERGDRTGLGLDLEWEAVAGVVGAEGDYAQPCTVYGEILVGGGGRPVETIDLDGLGWRRHAWGSAVDWFSDSGRVDGHLDDGTPYTGPADDRAAPAVLHRAPMQLELGSKRSVLERALCRFRTPAGVSGLGWSERIAAAGSGRPPTG